MGSVLWTQPIWTCVESKVQASARPRLRIISTRIRTCDRLSSTDGDQATRGSSVIERSSDPPRTRAGSDPTGAITELARKRKKQVRSISMGQGQEPAARKLVQQGMAQGSWVLLQNCHLGLKMMKRFQKL